MFGPFVSKLKSSCLLFYILGALLQRGVLNLALKCHQRVTAVVNLRDHVAWKEIVRFGCVDVVFLTLMSVN